MQIEDKFEINDEEAENIYTNLISFNISPEEVCMGIGIRDTRIPNQVNVSNYVYMSIPHFLRFADTVNKQVELLIDKGIISKEPEQ
jgi:hypothetical protein